MKNNNKLKGRMIILILLIAIGFIMIGSGTVLMLNTEKKDNIENKKENEQKKKSGKTMMK